MGLELVDQWSLFTCPDTGSLKDRIWQFKLEGSRLIANGPDGNSWTTTVSSEGAFKVNYIGVYKPQDLTHPVEVTGNVHSDPPWASQNQIRTLSAHASLGRHPREVANYQRIWRHDDQQTVEQPPFSS